MTELEIISYSQRQQRGRDSEWARLERKRLRSRMNQNSPFPRRADWECREGWRKRLLTVDDIAFPKRRRSDWPTEIEWREFNERFMVMEGVKQLAAGLGIIALLLIVGYIAWHFGGIR